MKALTKVRIPPVNPYVGVLNVFKESSIVASKTKLEEIGKEIIKRVKRVLRQQLYNWTPLTPNYVNYKKRHGLDPRTLIATGDYIKGIGIRKLANGEIEIGVKNRIHKPSGLSLKQIMRIHEFGATRRFTRKDGKVVTIHIPPRPHWRPVIAQIKKEIGQTKKQLAQSASVGINEWLKKNKSK